MIIPGNDEICTLNSLINAAICEIAHGLHDDKVIELRHAILKIIREELIFEDNSEHDSHREAFRKITESHNRHYASIRIDFDEWIDDFGKNLNPLHGPYDYMKAAWNAGQDAIK